MSRRRQCTATSKRTHEPCGAQPMVGSPVCYHHGGKAPQTVAAARMRILALADDMAAVLYDVATDTDQPAAVRVQAARDLLDRADVKTAQRLEVTTRDGDLADLDAALAALAQQPQPAATPLPDRQS